MNLVTGAGIIESVSTRKDKSLKVVISTQEAAPDFAGRLFGLNDQYIKFLFTVGEISTQAAAMIESIELEAPKTDEKSDSKQLRDALFVYWKNHPNGFEDFQKFYSYEIQRIKKHYLSKIEQ